MKEKNSIPHFFLLISILILNLNFCCCARNYSGIVIDSETKSPIQYVNIGIPFKNIGTCSDENGRFQINIDDDHANDSIKLTIIGYKTVYVKINQLYNDNVAIPMTHVAFNIKEVVINSKKNKNKILGVTAPSKLLSTGFSENFLGREMGIKFHVSKSAKINKLHLSISYCTYDSIFYRVNIYSLNKGFDTTSILKKPIYISLSKVETTKKDITIDLNDENIWVLGDFLISLEHVKNLGKGYLFFCGGLSHKTYYRMASQGNWTTFPIGIGLNIEASLEQ